jgi:hypothetical protein
MIDVDLNQSAAAHWIDSQTVLQRSGNICVRTRVRYDLLALIRRERIDYLLTQRAAAEDLLLGVEVLIIEQVSVDRILDGGKLCVLLVHFEDCGSAINGGLRERPDQGPGYDEGERDEGD